MARELGDEVKLQSPVYRIDQTGDMVVVETVNKQTYKVSISKDYYESATAIRFCKLCKPVMSELFPRYVTLRAYFPKLQR